MKLLNIEKELTGPNSQSALETYDGILISLDKRLGETMDNGLPPADFSKANALKEIVPLARKLLRLTVRDGQSS